MSDSPFSLDDLFKMPDAGGDRQLDSFLREGRSQFQLDTHNPAFLSVQIPDEPEQLQDYLNYLYREVVNSSVRTHDSRFIGHMTSALPDFLTPLTRIVSTLNQNVVKLETSGAFTAYERQALAMLHSLVYAQSANFYAEHTQNAQSTLGMMVSGGTLGNMAALWCARNRRFGPCEGFAGIEQEGFASALQFYGVRRAIIIGSSMMHYSLRKAVGVLGIGERNLITLAPKKDGRVDPEQVRAVINARRAEGDCVLAIVGIAGTTETGAIDPLNELADLAAEQGTHFHVDAAWGGPTLFSSTHAHLLAGIERADTVVIDGHKQLWLPMGTGMLLLKDPSLAKGIEKTANYIIRSDSSDLGRRSIEGSRPATAVYLHAALNLLGRKGYAKLIDSGLARAQFMAQQIEQNPAFELVSPPQLNILTYRYIPNDLRAHKGRFGAADEARIDSINVRLQVQQRDQGEGFVSRTRLFHTHKGVPIDVLRAVLANPLTSEADILAVLAEQAHLGAQLEQAPASLSEQFLASVQANPHGVALYDQGLAITYGELGAKVSHLAEQLRIEGLVASEIVGLAANRSVTYMAAMLAVMQLGATFLPLDPAYPSERLAYMLADSQARWLLTDDAGAAALASHSLNSISIDSLLARIPSSPQGHMAIVRHPRDALYIIYTSGSTGAPKGVIGLHSATRNRLSWMWQQYPFAKGEVACQKTSPSFVDSIWEMLGPLLAGVPSVIVANEVADNPSEFVKVLAHHQVTRLVLVPSQLRALLAGVENLGEQLPQLVHWVTSGEVLSRDLVVALRAAHPHASILNLYGSSEVAADVSHWQLTPSMDTPELTTMPIGSAISGVNLHLLNELGEPVTGDQIGELYVSGAAIAGGYLHKPELTRAQFVNLGAGEKTRMYRTGDLARQLADDSFVFVGRVDDQVKIDGVRIEPAEVRRALLEHPTVSDAVVVYNNKNAKAQWRLAAYLVARAGCVIDLVELRKAIEKQLVPQAVPVAYRVMDKLPLTPNGKIARWLLPELDER